MINPMKYKYLVAIMTADKKAYDITQFVEDVSWEEGEDQLAARISFSAKNDKTSKGRISSLAKPGCYAALLYSYNGGKNAEATRGKIVEWNPSARTSGEKFKVKAYDVLYDLQESQDHVYFSAGVKTKSAIVQVLKRWGIKVTSYSGPNVKHGKLAYKSEKLGTVVVKILKEAKKKGGIEACLRAVKMNVTVVGFGTNKTVYHFEETQHLTEVNHKISTTGMVTRVKIIGKANDDGSVIDQIAYEMSWHLKTRTVREHIYMVVPEEKLVKNVDIVDGMSGKIRTLGLEKMIMQLYEVLAKEAADELWTAKVGLFQVASIPGRGQAYGKKYIERWMSRDPEGTKYCVQSDIKKCYPSMSHDKILEFLRRDLGKSDMLLYLFETLIGLYSEAKVQNKEKDCKHGIFIGSPVSKDLCNYYLSYLYHYCTNELYEMKTRRGKTTRKRLIYHIMIQMDDIILFGSNKKDLHKAMLLVIEFVKSTLCLKIKDSWSLFRTGYVDRNGKQKGRDLDYMGLVFHGQNLIKRCYSGKTVTIRNVSTRIRASIFLKARRKIHRFAKKIKNKKIIGSKFAMSTIAYNGWFVTTDSFLVRVAECWDQLISMAKNIISRYAKQKSYAMEKYYKKWRKLNYA